MKAFKKLALVAAISAAPFAQAELVSIDDAVMSDMTGQAGITIELSTNVTIDSLTYSDTDGLPSGGAGVEGSLILSTIEFGGAVQGDSFDEVKIDIDVDSEAGLVIHLGGTDLQGILTGTNPVDFGLRVGSVEVGTAAAANVVLASGIVIEGNLGPVDIAITNRADIGAGQQDVTDFISVSAYFEVTNGSMDIDVLGLGITNLEVYGSDAFAASSNATYAGLSAIGGGDDRWAHVAMLIGTTSTSYNTFDGAAFVTVDIDSALNVNVTSMAMNVEMDLSMGTIFDGTDDVAQSLGHLNIQGLDLSGTSLTIYGH